MKTLSENAAFGGVQAVYSHDSDACGCEMTFAAYLPPQAKAGRVAVLWYLSGLTCTHENAMLKAGAQGWAAEEGIAVIFPDTSPRGAGVADDEAYDLGQGAGFYVNATEAPWAPHFEPARALARLDLGQRMIPCVVSRGLAPRHGAPAARRHHRRESRWPVAPGGPVSPPVHRCARRVRQVRAPMMRRAEISPAAASLRSARALRVVCDRQLCSPLPCRHRANRHACGGFRRARE